MKHLQFVKMEFVSLLDEQRVEDLALSVDLLKLEFERGFLGLDQLSSIEQLPVRTLQFLVVNLLFHFLQN